MLTESEIAVDTVSEQILKCSDILNMVRLSHTVFFTKLFSTIENY